MPQDGLIPAGAGNMLEKRDDNHFSWAHPRGCGEHLTSEQWASVRKGSSPRVRGTYEVEHHGLSYTGLIPAGAGNMCTRKRYAARRGAHPRGCGEHRYATTQLLKPAGSSPRVRGTFLIVINPGSNTGLIPAGAGNIRLQMRQRRKPGAHPRGCGEHVFYRLYRPLGTGSSPRVRGTWVIALGLLATRGLIPAGAGNMRQKLVALAWLRAHPRGCGEHQIHVSL